MRRISIAMLLLATACRGSDAPSSAIGEGSSLAPGLERAAIDSGVIADAARLSPIGLYQRTHEAGRDALCLIPDKLGDFRFGTRLSFGEDQSCRGEGKARQAGDKLILHFAGSGCIIVARYDGDQLTFPGVVDVKCADLCEGRGSMEGVTLPRITNDAASALRAQDADGRALCKAD